MLTMIVATFASFVTLAALEPAPWQLAAVERAKRAIRASGRLFA
ncbi:MAG TPA: hypothetical protein VF158_14360 [Longimicrobiales bacterium]